MKTIVVLVLLFLAGCAGDCIRAGISYDDKIGGTIEYCLAKEATAIYKIPVLEGSDSSKNYSLTEDMIKEIVERLKSGQIGIKEESDPVAELLLMLREKK